MTPSVSSLESPFVAEAPSSGAVSISDSDTSASS